MKFPNPCVRCGFCCLVETCPIGQAVFGIGKHDKCEALSFDENGIASCNIANSISYKNLIPLGDGCCISARCYKDGAEYQFADLPKELKHEIAQNYRNNKIIQRR